MHRFIGIALGVAMMGSTICGQDTPDAPGEGFPKLRDAYLAKFKPLWLEVQQAWWIASTTGSDAAFARKQAAEKALVELHGDQEMFRRIKTLREDGTVVDPVHRRELDEMYRAFLPGQVDPAIRNRIVEIENRVEQTFNTHRSQIGGKSLSENDVREILSETTDPRAAEAAWKAYMAVGAKVEDELRELVALRNKSARTLGFDNFYAMSLALQEIDEKEFFTLFDELDALTREPFAELKRGIDARMAKRFGVSVEQLRPWHLGDLFFQEAPQVQGVNLDEVFENAAIIDLARKYYASIGLPCDDVIERSDLYEKPGKSPHAFCNDMDREGDVRVLCNVKPNLYWADTVLHELGHAVYDKYISRDVPFLLREASHSITTEGIAMMFGAMVKNEDWLVNVRGLGRDEAAGVVQAARATLRADKILFCRWTQVMMRFEHGMYANPDQDLAKLWWDLKKRYQLQNPPDRLDQPDYAAKMHVLIAPVYYHSYMMGDLFAAQVQHHIARNVLRAADPSATSFQGKPRAGDYLKEKIFGPGNLYQWNELTRRATGEPLTAKYFAAQFVNHSN